MRSLFARNALLLAALIVLGQVGAAVLARRMVIEPRLERAADGLARTVRGLRAGLLAMPRAEREPFLRAFNGRAAEGPAPRAIDQAPRTTALARQLALRLAPDEATVAWWREPDGALGLRIQVEGEPHLLVLPGALPRREFTGAWIATTLCGAALALVGAVAIQRRLDRPLRRVVEAAGQLARGAAPDRLPEDGPTETATLSRSINHLVDSLAGAERERALMLAGVSHDLRTPLTKLRLGIEIVGDGIEPELRASMERSIEEMDRIVGGFLDFARVGEAEPRSTGDLDALARDIVRGAADHGRVMDLDAGHPPPVAFQPLALRRAVDNLVENAFRHGEPPVLLRTGHGGGQAWIEVIDHGVGVPSGQAESMKQPFRRAGPARTGDSGAGLGLAIADRVARAHGGRLELLPHRPGHAEGDGLRARIAWPTDRLADRPANR